MLDAILKGSINAAGFGRCSGAGHSGCASLDAGCMRDNRDSLRNRPHLYDRATVVKWRTLSDRETMLALDVQGTMLAPLKHL